ncbi:MAG TPA: hypothetical protein VMC09_00370 [Anaerolineales bacterium]|nr:hypothetical protein [Anaerolineales bacterium]
MKILLFDMDGVLLESLGYHLALQETVRRMASRLGFGEATLAPDDIAAFESGGVTCEWDEAAIATALLLETAWKEEPGCGVPDSLARAEPPRTDPRPAPDFHALALALTSPALLSFHPLERAERHFLGSNSFDSAQAGILRELLREARNPRRSLTHRTFQELVLGSREFENAYHLPAVLDTESYLLKYDRSNLTEAESTRLRGWMSAPGQRAVVITSRPSKPPAGIFSTLEAELGAKLIGLEDIPIMGWGGMVWLGEQRRVDPQTFLKPSPIHALAGMRMALGESQEAALAVAADLVEANRSDEIWQELADTQVTVFEDTPGGIRSLQAARAILGRAGIEIDAKYYGIAQKQIKIESLARNGASVYPTLREALERVIEGRANSSVP